MRHLVIATAAVAVLAGGSLTAQRKPYRGVNDTYTAACSSRRAPVGIFAPRTSESWFSRRPGFCRCPSARR